MDHYIYRRIFQSVRYDIRDNGIEYVSRDIHGTNRDMVSFDEIGARETQFSSASKIALGGTIILAIISVMLFIHEYGGNEAETGAVFFYLSGSVLCAIYYLHSRRGGVLLASSLGSIVILGNPKKIRPFVEAVRTAQISALEKKLTDRQALVEHEEVARYILYLRDGGVIDEDTFLRFRKLIDKDDDSQSLGFNL